MSCTTFWDEQHEAKTFWIGGVAPEVALMAYGIDWRYGAPERVMDIGIGNGQMIQYLLGVSQRVTAVDVSTIALARAMQLGARASESCHLSGAEPVDAAFCTLVMQHVDDNEVLRIINDVPLNRGGTLYVQFATSVDVPKTRRMSEELGASMSELDRHFYFRTRHEVEALLALSSKRLVGQVWANPLFLVSDAIVWLLAKLENE